MKKIIPVFLILFILSQGSKYCLAQEIKSLVDADKVILLQNGNEEFFYWELEDENSLWEFELGSIKALQLYRDSLKLELGDEKYEAGVKKEATQNLEKTRIEKSENGDRINAILVHTGSIGSIRKINHIEAQILNYQIERFPMFSHPTEFHGFITKNETEGKIRIYFGASDTEWPPHPDVIIEELNKEIKLGWKLKYHLHNHYCKKEKNYVGILAPSLADAQYYKMLSEKYAVEKTLITNGFHTVEIDKKDFAKFESH